MSSPFYYKAICKRYPILISLQSVNTGTYVFDFSPKRLPWCEVGFVQKGRIREYREDREWIHEEGGIYTFAAPASLRHYSEDPEHVEIFLRFRVQEWQPMTREEVLRWKPAPGEFLLSNHISDPSLCRQLEPLIKRAVHIYNSQAVTRETQALSVLWDILARIGEHTCREAAAAHAEVLPRDAAYCRRACDYIREHLAEKLSAEEISRHVGLSYSRLSRVFRSTMGMTLVEYIQRQRLYLAQSLLLRDGLRQEEAAQRVGFCSAKYMQRLFRRYNGITFTQHRSMEIPMDQAKT